MARLKEEQILEVREKSDIVDIIGRYLPLKKQGKNYVALCPFHDDNNPSMSISPEKQIYKCFVCGAGGNVFTFIQNYEQSSFVEAVIKCASLALVEIEIDSSLSFKKQYDAKTLNYFKIMQEATQFLNYQLQSGSGKDAKEYLNKRKITDDTIKDFLIGYNNENELSTFLLKKGYDIKDLIELNLVVLQNDQVKDVFTNRIVFPILDSYNNIVAFTARSLKKDITPKYINSAETNIYTKGDILFNYQRVKKEARSKGHLYLVEGVVDALALYQAQITNVVASLGTALTKQQVNLLKIAASTIRICYDGDAAGQLATLKTGKLLLAAGCQVEVVNCLEGLDPDDYRLKYDEEALMNALNKPISWLEYFMKYSESKYDFTNYSQRKDYAVLVCKEIAALADSLDQSYFIKLLAEKTGFEQSALVALLPNQKQTKVKKVQSRKVGSQVIPKSIRAEYEIISQMLLSKEAALYFREHLGVLLRQNTNKVVLLILDFYRQHEELVVANFLSLIDDSELQKLVVAISEMELVKREYDLDLLKEAILEIKLSLIDLQIEAVKRNSGSELNKISELSILKQEKERLLTTNQL